MGKTEAKKTPKWKKLDMGKPDGFPPLETLSALRLISRDEKDKGFTEIGCFTQDDKKRIVFRTGRGVTGKVSAYTDLYRVWWTLVPPFDGE